MAIIFTKKTEDIVEMEETKVTSLSVTKILADKASSIKRKIALEKQLAAAIKRVQDQYTPQIKRETDTIAECNLYISKARDAGLTIQ